MLKTAGILGGPAAGVQDTQEQVGLSPIAAMPATDLTTLIGGYAMGPSKAASYAQQALKGVSDDELRLAMALEKQARLSVGPVKEFEFELSSKGATILDEAINIGADVPFSCKGGVCCVCKAKVLEGSVRMDQNFSLSEEDVAQGYILGCQAHPLSEKVVVDFDEM